MTDDSVDLTIKENDDDKELAELEESKPKPNFQFVGLNSSNNGRSCSLHVCCGDHVRSGDLLRLLKCIVVINGVTEEAIKLVKIINGTDTCTVGFIPREELKNTKIQASINKFCQVVELYDESESGYKRKLSHRNYGMATAVFLEDIPISE